MPQSNDIVEIRFATKGEEELLNAFKGLAKGQKKFNEATDETQKGLKKLARGQQRVTGSTDKMGNAFSVIRSKMLLFNFAMTLGVRQILQFAKEAAKVDAMETAFTNMSGSVSIAEERLNALKSATNGTMTEFDLFQQANNAMILGLTRNTEEMAEMFDAAQRLGRALGRDTKSSIESLVTGIGRQSRLMLDNIGIIVKTEEAYEKYAVSLGTTAASLSDIEKKQAFFNAAMEAAEQKLLILGAEIPTSQDALDSIGVTFSELGVNIGKAFLPMLTSVADTMGTFSKLLTPKRVEAYTKVIGALGLGLLAYIGYLKRAIIWQTRTGWGALATAAGFLAAEVLLMSSAFDDVEDSTANARAESVAYLESLKAEKIEGLNEQLKKQKEILDGISNPLDAMKERINSLQNSMNQMDMGSEDYKAARDAIDGLHKAMADLVAAGVVDAIGDTEQKKRVAALIVEIEKYQGIITTSGLSLGEFNVAQDKANALYNKTPEAIKASVQANIDFIKGLDESVLSIEKQAEVLAFLKDKLRDVSGANISTKFDDDLVKAKGLLDVATAKGNKGTEKGIELNKITIAGLAEKAKIDAKIVSLSRQKEKATDAEKVVIEKIIPILELARQKGVDARNVDRDAVTAKYLLIDALKLEETQKLMIAAMSDGELTFNEEKAISEKKILELQTALNLEGANTLSINKQIFAEKKKLISLEAQETQQKLKNYSKIAGGLASLNTAMKGSMKATVRLQQVQAMIDAYAGAQSGWAMNKKAYPFPIPELLYAADIATGLAQARALSNSIGDKFEKGGMVGGRRHSQGGTIIEAEQGEFVMSRNAVDSVGLEAMNRINSGGGAGAVSINFTGNVMSQDFIEDEAIPMIKEAIRRGADIGVA